MKQGRFLQKIKLLLPGLLLWGLLFWMLALGFQNAARLDEGGNSVSLRFESPLTEAETATARRYAAKTPDGPWPSFWREDTINVQSELRESETQVVSFSGDANAVYPRTYLLGGCPGPADSGGCALSEDAAFRLWGAKDVVGNPLTIGETTYTVRGVFAGDDPLVLCSTGDFTPEKGWTCAELTGLPGENPRGEGADFAKESGLGEPRNLMVRPGIRRFAGRISFLTPTLLAAGIFIALLLHISRPFTPQKQILAFGCALLFAIFLPRLLALVPPAYLPTRWSDFSHWSNLWQQSTADVRQLMRLLPFSRDFETKSLLIRQALFAALALLAALAAVTTRPFSRFRESLLNTDSRRASSPRSGSASFQPTTPETTTLSFCPEPTEE